MARQAAVTLEAVTDENRPDCLALRLTPEQTTFVADVATSLAQAEAFPQARGLAVRDAAGAVVGFALYGVDQVTGQWKIFRMLVDKAQQGRGVGTAATRALVDHMRAEHAASTILITWQDRNAVARRVYERLGFREYGRDGGKVFARLGGKGPPARHNFFRLGPVAERYASSRPDVHDVPVRFFVEAVQPVLPIPRALDVACGTGLSTRAVAAIATTTLGVDPSQAMLRHAATAPGCSVVAGTSVALPIADGSIDLISVSCAFHWFDQLAFLAEARRVLAPGGWLLVSNNWFTGRMLGEDGFGTWFREDYLRRFPSPPRQPTAELGDSAAEGGFEVAHEQADRNEVPMSARELVGFLTSQSNIVAVVEQGDRGLAEVVAELDAGVGPFFPGGAARTMLFEGRVWCLRRAR